MAIGNMVGRTIKFEDWKGDARSGRVVSILDNGDYEVSTDSGMALVSNDEIIKMRKGGYVPKSKKLTARQQAKLEKVLHEFKMGELHSGSKTGPIVKSRKQALAIGLAEARSTKMARGGSMYADGGSADNDRMYNFLKDDLETLHTAIMDGNMEEVNKFFSYWNYHLDSLKTSTNDRMFNFLKDDLNTLESAIENGDNEEIERFFSYWNYHLESLKMAKGGRLDVGVYRVGKPTKVSPNLYEQKIVEIFDNGDIATASDYGRKLSDFKSQKHPVITKEQLDSQYKMAQGGSISRHSVDDYDLETLQETGMTIKKINDILMAKFPDSFGFTLYPIKDNSPANYRNLIPNTDEYYGIKNETLKLKFNKYHGMSYRVFQGGENTYFYFILDGSDGEGYIGSFGFKDQGDVPKEYVTSFIALLCKLYGYPFKVSHEVFAKGGSLYADGGIVDLFEDYDNIPENVQGVLDEYSEDFEDGNYAGMQNAKEEIEQLGYTFDFYVDGTAYGLRPVGVELNELEGYEEMAKGGALKGTTYVSNRDIKKIAIEKGGQKYNLTNKNIIDGVYVKDVPLNQMVKSKSVNESLSVFKKIVKESSSFDEAFEKAKTTYGIPLESARYFSEKYNPSGKLSQKETFKVFYDEIKGGSIGWKHKMAKGGYVVANMDYKILGSFKTENEAQEFARNLSKKDGEIYRFGTKEKIERYAKEDGYRAQGGSMGLKHKMAQGGYVVANMDYKILGSFKTENEAQEFARNLSKKDGEIYRFGTKEKIERYAKEDGYRAKGGSMGWKHKMEKGGGIGKKIFSINPHSIGKAKYVIDYYDGKSKHNDGSPFIGIKTFSNKIKLEQEVKKLKSEGYTKVSNVFNAIK